MKIKHLLKLSLLFSLAVWCPIAAIAGDDHEHGHGDHGQEGEEDAHGHSEEGVVKLTDEALTNVNIAVREAGPATLTEKLRVTGRIAPISSNVAHIASRFSGIIREVKKDIGDTIAAGDVLAVIESNQNLQTFEVRALKGGIITDRHATIGESVKEDDALFIVMDLSQLWADFTVFQRDVSKIKIGQPIDVYIVGRLEPFKSKLSFISPIVDDTTQSRIARAVIKNPDYNLAPGAFITGQILVADYQVPIAVTYDGIQSIEGKNVVFIKDHDGFERREIVIGRSDGTHSEVLSGITSGEKYAATNSFILKADLGKSEAEHEH